MRGYFDFEGLNDLINTNNKRVISKQVNFTNFLNYVLALKNPINLDVSILRTLTVEMAFLRDAANAKNSAMKISTPRRRIKKLSQMGGAKGDSNLDI